MTAQEAFEKYLSASKDCASGGNAPDKLEAERQALYAWIAIAKAEEPQAAKVAAWNRYMEAQSEVRRLTSSGAALEDIKAAQASMFRSMGDYLKALRAV